MNTLKNPTYNLEIDPEQGCFSFIPTDESFPSIHRARLKVNYLFNHQKMRILDKTWQPLGSSEQTLDRTSLTYFSGPHPGGLMCQIEFACPPSLSFPIWRIQLENQGSDFLIIEQIELLNVGGQSDRGSLEFLKPTPSENLTFYSNGWQSWSPSLTYSAKEAMNISRLGRFQQPMILNSGTPTVRQAGYFSSDFFGVVSNQQSRTGILVGLLSQREHFGSVESILYDRPSLRVWANGDDTLLTLGATMTTDWSVLMPVDLDQPDPLGSYLEAVAREYAVKLPDSIPSGWCSWYQFYTRVSAENIRANLHTILEKHTILPLDLVQIDDGFEAQVGDWFDFKPTFPDGVSGLAAEIKAANRVPGIWLAPLIVHPKAELARHHPEYLLRTARGKPVNAGFVWNTFANALDPTVPGALEYACKAVATAAHEWGYPYLKLDFLYAAALPGRYHDRTRTRAQVLRQAMQALREAAGPDTFLLGCGAPLGSVLGLVEAMRIGADVSGYWDPEFMGIRFPLKQELAVPCARNSIQNILTRAPLHKRWWINDPDCLLIRPDTDLTLAEIQSLATAIGLTGGSLLLSDDLPALPPERFRIAQVLMPVLGKRAEVLDLFEPGMPRFLRLDMEGPTGRWHLLAHFNWSDAPRAWHFRPLDFKLPNQPYLFSSFWDSSTGMVEPGQGHDMPEIHAHGVALLAMYPQGMNQPQYLGNNLHFSQGAEVTTWQPKENELLLKLSLQHAFEGYFDLNLPREPISAELDHQVLQWNKLPDGRFRFVVKSETVQPAEVQIRF